MRSWYLVRTATDRRQISLTLWLRSQSVVLPEVRRRNPPAGNGECRPYVPQVAALLWPIFSQENLAHSAGWARRALTCLPRPGVQVQQPSAISRHCPDGTALAGERARLLR